MESSRWASDMENLSLSERPSKNSNAQLKTPSNAQQKNQAKPSQVDNAPNNETDSRQAALRNALESVRRINQVIEGVTASLEKAKSNMAAINTTVSNAHTLLETWTRILSQTEHNQRLLLDPTWEGASADLADIENESVLRQRDAERRAAEEAERRAVAEERKRQEEERRRIEAEKREAAANARTVPGRPGSRVGAGASRGGRTVSGTSAGRGAATGASRTSSAATGREGLVAGSGPSKTGRGAIAGYGRIGSVGTKAGRGAGAGRGVG